jgi:hypothetical protein
MDVWNSHVNFFVGAFMPANMFVSYLDSYIGFYSIRTDFLSPI